MGNLVRAAFQVFPMAKTSVCEPVLIDTPNEITLAQLVAHFVVPSGGDWDVNTVFYWCHEEIEDKDQKKRTIIEIPNQIPTGFVLRVKANTLRDGPSNKRMAKCIYESTPMCFMIEQNEPVGKLKERMIDWMRQRGLGEERSLDRPDTEAIGFDYQYVVKHIEEEEEGAVHIFLKQRLVEVRKSETWMHV